MRCMGRTEADRKITDEPWSSKQSLTEQRRPLFGVKGMVCPKKEKREQLWELGTNAGSCQDLFCEFFAHSAESFPFLFVPPFRSRDRLTSTRRLRRLPGHRNR